LQGLVIDSYSSQKDLRKVMTSTRDPAVMLSKVDMEKDSYVRHQIDQELQADACSVRMLVRAYPDNVKVLAAMQAFLKDLPESEAKQDAAQAAPKPAPIPGKVGEMHFLTQEVVKTPESRHPTSSERVSNLRTTYDEVRKSR
jgi:hypothetical protein